MTATLRLAFLLRGAAKEQDVSRRLWMVHTRLLFNLLNHLETE
ncbi:MAG TPA: hypothetical protein VG326_10545 [Tepidisphaeraceae bacterium]|jgi:hypothetical protein|nr:hypothetical protein [Tepidisphaeraceae bacterium]